MIQAWEDFYSTNNPTRETYIDKSSQQTPSGNYIFVVYSLFRSFSSSSQGGCIKVSSTSCDFLVEETSFIEINNSQIAAALYLSAKNVIYNKICGFKCKTTTSSNDIFDYVYLVDSTENKNQILSSSIVYTTNTADACYLLYHKYGLIIAKETNFSKNECRHISAIICYPSYSQGKISVLISFSSFANNIATKDYGCIYFGTSHSKQAKN